MLLFIVEKLLSIQGHLLDHFPSYPLIHFVQSGRQVLKWVLTLEAAGVRMQGYRWLS